MEELQKIFDVLSGFAFKLDNIRFPLLGFTAFSLWDFCVGLFATSVVITFLRMLFGLSTDVGSLSGGLYRTQSAVEKRDRTRDRKLTRQTGLKKGQAVVDMRTGEIIGERINR